MAQSVSSTDQVITLYKANQGYANTNSRYTLNQEATVTRPSVLADRVFTQAIPVNAPSVTQDATWSVTGTASSQRWVAANSWIVQYRSIKLSSVSTNPNMTFTFSGTMGGSSVPAGTNILANMLLPYISATTTTPYTVTVSTDAAGANVIPNTNYILDRDAGILVVYPGNGVSQGSPPYISFWRYEGSTLAGLSSAITASDTSTNIVNLNATSGLHVYKPSVATALSLSVTDICSGSVVLTGSSQGKLFIGSSAAASKTILVADNGTSNSYVNIGGNGGNDLQISGGKSTDGINKCYIYPTAGSGGILQIGSSSSASYSSAIMITDSATTIKNITSSTPSSLAAVNTSGLITANAGITVASPGYLTQATPGKLTYGPTVPLTSEITRGTGNYDFSIAAYPTGLYMIMMRVAEGNRDDSTTLENMFSGLVYIQQVAGAGTSVVVGGGAIGNTNIYIRPVVTSTNGAGAIRVTQGPFNAYYSVKMLQLFSALPGFDS